MTDEALVRRYLSARDPADFKTLVDRHGGQVIRIVSSVLGPFRDIDAEDLAQDVFVRVHDKLAQFRADARFTTWLYRIAYSVALNRLKTARLRLPHVPADTLAAMAVPDQQHAGAIDAERAAAVAAAIETLPALYRTAIYLHYWHETSVEDIATLLQVPENTVKSYLRRGRLSLARDLEKRGVTP